MRRTKIERRGCPNCGGLVEVREDLAHGTLRCPSCKMASNHFVEAPVEEEVEYGKRGTVKKTKVKYPKRGPASERIPFLPTTLFGKVPQEYRQAIMDYKDMKNSLEYVSEIKTIRDIDAMKSAVKYLDEIRIRHGSEKIGGRGSIKPNADFGYMGADFNRITKLIHRTMAYAQEAQEDPESRDEVTGETMEYRAKEALKMAKRQKKTLLEKIVEREGQLEENKREYTSRLETYARAAAIIGISGSIIFLSSNITGNVIANLTPKASNLLGAGLFILGISCLYFWKKRK
jgi:hypothetical protein